MHYKKRVNPLATTPETFWVVLFDTELAALKNTSVQILIRKFLSGLRIIPMEFDRGLICQALTHHLSQFSSRQRGIILLTFHNWATLPPCLRRSTDSEKEAQRSARSRRATTKAA